MWRRLKCFWISDLKNAKHGGFKSHGIPSNPITVSVLPSVQNQTIIFFKSHRTIWRHIKYIFKNKTAEEQMI